MKKLFLLLLLISALSLKAQGIYIKIGGGYELSNSSSLIFGNVSHDTSTIEGQYGSYGEGILPSIGFGYLFNNNIGLEINGSYLIGKRFGHEHTEGAITETHKKWGEGILISPSLMIQVPLKSITPYTRFGGIVGLIKVKEEETESGTGARTGANITEHTGNIALGFNGALGIMFNAGKRLKIFAELYGQGMNYGPKKRENPETFSGETPNQTLNYEDEYSTNTANTTLRPRFPFSNFGLNIGVIMSLGKISKAKK